MISAPFPNQFECEDCEQLEGELGIHDPDVSTPDGADVEPSEPAMSSGPDAGDGGEEGYRDQDLRDAITDSALPPLDMKPDDKEMIIDRIDGAANEEKFRSLHLDGTWERFYDDDELDDPIRAAIVGYLRIIAFYSRLSVLHVEAFYRSSALYDEDVWSGWDRLELLEKAIESQADNDPGYRMYGTEDTFQNRLRQARRRLDLMERRIDR